MIPDIKIISPNVAVMYPILGSRRMYRKREKRTKMTFIHVIPFHISVNFSLPFFFTILVTIRMIENVPRTTPAQKGRNPAPGEWKVPRLT
jgi:hypothetical protein